MNPETEWVETVSSSELEEGRPRLVHVHGVPVLLILMDGEVYALSNSCAHMGCPLVDGLLEGEYLRCPCHEWAYDIRTGELWEAPEITIDTFDVKEENGDVWVRLQREGP